MKKLITSSVLLIMCITGYSQNTFPTTGNVGIGTDSPSTNLEISARNPSLKFKSWGNGDYDFQIKVNYNYGNKFSFESGGTPFFQKKTIPSSDGDTYSKLLMSNYGGIGFGTFINGDLTDENQLDFYIAKSGNVGIGTTSPEYKLNVESSDFIVSKFNRISGSGGAAIEMENGLKTGSWRFGVGANNAFSIYKSSNNFGEQFTIDDDGKVGIGTELPSEKFEVSGFRSNLNGIFIGENGNKITFTGDVSDGSGSITTGNNKNLEFREGGQQNVIFDGNRVIEAYGTDFTTVNFRINHRGDGNLGSSYLLGSDLGIGTNTPLSKLDVEGGDFYLGEEVSGNGQRRQIRVYGYDNGSKFYGSIHSNYEDSKRTFHIYSNSSTNQIKIDASANASGSISILPGENTGVGIGIINPGAYKLAVLGNIRATEIKVEASPWSDFVFEKEYNLPTLKEVEQHIKEKGHLSSIPSAAEVAEKGIFLGEMNAKLLQKIEELTLYTIQQEKKLQLQQNELNVEKEKNKIFEKRLLKLEKAIKN